MIGPESGAVAIKCRIAIVTLSNPPWRRCNLYIPAEPSYCFRSSRVNFSGPLVAAATADAILCVEATSLGAVVSFGFRSPPITRAMIRACIPTLYTPPFLIVQSMQSTSASDTVLNRVLDANIPACIKCSATEFDTVRTLSCLSTARIQLRQRSCGRCSGVDMYCSVSRHPRTSLRP